jgi:hypothetical protein
LSGGVSGARHDTSQAWRSGQIAADEDKLIHLGQREVDGIVSALHDRTPARLAGVDTSAIKRVDPEFDDEAFRAIARETFSKVREARGLQDPRGPAELLSPQMQRDVQDVISGDVACHRHHLLPFLTITDAVIAAAEVIAAVIPPGSGETRQTWIAGRPCRRCHPPPLARRPTCGLAIMCAVLSWHKAWATLLRWPAAGHGDVACREGRARPWWCG